MKASIRNFDFILNMLESHGKNLDRLVIKHDMMETLIFLSLLYGGKSGNYEVGYEAIVVVWKGDKRDLEESGSSGGGKMWWGSGHVLKGELEKEKGINKFSRRTLRFLFYASRQIMVPFTELRKVVRTNWNRVRVLL